MGLAPAISRVMRCLPNGAVGSIAPGRAAGTSDGTAAAAATLAVATAAPMPLRKSRRSALYSSQGSIISFCLRRSRLHNVLHVFLGKEVGVGDRAGIETQEAVDLFLIAAQSAQELLHFGRRRLER